jgi:hypothetical protein
MRLALALLPELFLSVLLHAQTPQCSGCPNSEAGSSLQVHAPCLSSSEMYSHIATRSPVAPPGLNELHMNSHGIVEACLCFSRRGKVTDLRVLSGPAMMRQSVLDSVDFSPGHAERTTLRWLRHPEDSHRYEGLTREHNNREMSFDMVLNCKRWTNTCDHAMM